MEKIVPFVAAAALLALLPAAAIAQDKEARCRSEIANRGFGNYNIESAQTRDNVVRGVMRAGGEVREFQCDVDNMGNVTEVRVDFVGNAGPRTRPDDDSREYRRGYADGSRRTPYNNYRNDADYNRGYDKGYEESRRRRR